MAFEKSLLLFNLSLLITTFSLLPSPTSSSRIITPSHTSLLDVSSSIHQTKQILTFNPNNNNLLEQSSNYQQETLNKNPIFSNSSSFSILIHPRETLLNENHKDYRKLILSRLTRDSARVNSLTTKLELSLNNLKKTDLYPVQTELQQEDLSTPVSSGSGAGSGEYFTRLGIGQPPKPYYMVLDTGSDVNWIQCKPCTECYQQMDPIYDPTTSSTYQTMSCEVEHCQKLEVSACRDGKCQYQVSYGDGSFTVGDYSTETVSFGTSGSINQVAIGCGHDNEGLFVGAAGLIGLGGGSQSLTSQIKASSFSYCLVDRDSGKSSTLEFNSVQPSDSVLASMLKSQKVDTFYFVQLTGISVGAQMVAVPAAEASGSGGIIVDSGTAVTRLQSQVYNSVRDEFKRMTQNLRSADNFALFDTCYDLSNLQSVRVPTVAFHFGGDKVWSLPAKNYLIPVDSSGTFCFAFAPTSSSLSIIGNVQQQGTRVTFDLANNLMGFSNNKC